MQPAGGQRCERDILSQLAGGEVNPTAAELDAFMGKVGPWPSVHAYTAAMLKDITLLLSVGEVKYVECVGDETHFAGPTLPAETSTNQRPTEAELLAAELAKPPLGVSVEQWHAHLASRSEACSTTGTVYSYRMTPGLVATERARVDSGCVKVSERIMKHAAAKKNWWEK